jgi:3-hydroxy-3-methylglutaryl CoA synthase
MSKAVGIDDINSLLGPLTISYDTVARARGLSDRQRLHAQFVRRAVVPPFEDTVTLAVKRRRSRGGRCRSGVHRPALVATESPIDYAIPVSTPSTTRSDCRPRAATSRSRTRATRRFRASARGGMGAVALRGRSPRAGDLQ